MSIMAAFIPDCGDAEVSWLLIGELGGQRHAQVRGPREATTAELDDILTLIGWERRQDWVTCDQGWPVSLEMQEVDERLAAVYRARI